ncbi:MurR/RpiR family transcriptional regulator [Mannheimia massilioguelmaensis]|uniref:MurR/RpiR family transcriptional regulator n=1 Tax=Mannheimia massilioguelmaensis TaxID=1604354 RepID=UPI0005CB4C70|nr:MurR/RpiR family transcriptional regulator [Mannheimia massilioguelmaensis]
MENKDTIFQRIEQHKEIFSAKQRKLSDYIIANYQTAAFLNSTDLAHTAGVSGSTVIRFAETLGYDGFPKMKEALHQIIQQDINTVDAFMDSEQQLGSYRALTDKSIFQPCIQTFHTIERSLSPELLDQSAELLAKADNIFIIGFQGAAFLSEYMAYFLSKVRKNVKRVNSLDSVLFENILSTDLKHDAVLIYAFPRFPTLTLQLAQYFHNNNVPIVCMSSTTENPISELANIVIPIDIEYRAYIDHLAPVVYLSEVLGKKIAKLNQMESMKQLAAFEQYAEAAHIFCSNK